MGSFSVLAAIGLSWLSAWALSAGLIRWAPRIGLVDHPAERKFHTRTTPKGGGLAIFAGMMVASASWFVLQGHWPISAASCVTGFVIVALGLVDDLRPLPWQLRLAVQTAAAVGWLAWDSGIPPTLWPLALVWIVGLTNAFNMLDNMDGLSAGVAWIGAACLVLIEACCPQLGGISDATVSKLQFLGAVGGFLFLNWPPARIFMGDAGSTFLGFFLGIHSLGPGLIDPGRPWHWVVPVCILAVPWYDLTTVVILRLGQGRSPFQADKQHLSHRLVARGWSSSAAVRLICLLAVAGGVGGLVLYHLLRGG